MAKHTKRARHSRAVMSQRQANRMEASEGVEGDPSDYVVIRTPEAIARLVARRRLEDRREENEIATYFSL